MRIGIIGGGIVGTVAAFYLSQTKHEVILWDDGIGQATRAAAGIICPWFSKRRNKAWYRLANQGAHLFPTLIDELAKSGVTSHAYEQKTTWLLKNKETLLDELIALAKKRQEEAPLITSIKRITPEEQRTRLQGWHYSQDVIEVEGAAILDGEAFCQDVRHGAQTNGITYINDTASIQAFTSHTVTVNDTILDALIIAAGPAVKSLLTPHGYKVEVKAEKGQLAIYKNVEGLSDWPLIMPEGISDIIPHNHQLLYIGATHEKDNTTDLTVDPQALSHIWDTVHDLLPSFPLQDYDQIKVGTRAYNDTFSPFYGPIQNAPHIYAASALGSSGLTTGPLIALEMVRQLLHRPLQLNSSDYATEPYIYKLSQRG